jgi:undecaprenyl-diphosphatase
MLATMKMRAMLPIEPGTGVQSIVPFAALDGWEAGICVRCNRLARRAAARRFFSLASRLGDGIAWYATLVLLPLLQGREALLPSLHMGATALVAVLVYKAIKGALVRERPFNAHREVQAILRPLDRYSFPSGHTMHAVAFTIMLGHYFPALLVVAVPFALSVAASRVVLGLHYPTDVGAGALVGAILAGASILVFG